MNKLMVVYAPRIDANYFACVRDDDIKCGFQVAWRPGLKDTPLKIAREMAKGFDDAKVYPTPIYTGNNVIAYTGKVKFDYTMCAVAAPDFWRRVEELKNGYERW